MFFFISSQFNSSVFTSCWEFYWFTVQIISNGFPIYWANTHKNVKQTITLLQDSVWQKFPIEQPSIDTIGLVGELLHATMTSLLFHFFLFFSFSWLIGPSRKLSSSSSSFASFSCWQRQTSHSTNKASINLLKKNDVFLLRLSSSMQHLEAKQITCTLLLNFKCVFNKDCCSYQCSKHWSCQFKPSPVEHTISLFRHFPWHELWLKEVTRSVTNWPGFQRSQVFLSILLSIFILVTTLNNLLSMRRL